VDDEPDVRKSLSNFIRKLGHETVCSVDGHQGLERFESDRFDLVIADIRMPGIDGIEFLRQIKVVARSPINIIMITGHGDMDNAIKALKYGAYDYLQKPIDVSELAMSIERCNYGAPVRNGRKTTRDETHEGGSPEVSLCRSGDVQTGTVAIRDSGSGSVCVLSGAMHESIVLAEKYASDRSIPVLVEGESGTGKEIIARFIHYRGDQHALAPFVAINCAAITNEHLFEGELFGHERGAYTGAAPNGRVGKLEVANGGTIFFDEIGEMPPNLQVKLLRVLEEKRLYRLGGIREVPIDVRIISATNKDLAGEVRSGRFRLDLFYRINIGHIRIPPLRERKDAILPLARHFIRQACATKARRFEGFTPEAERFLMCYSWPGNVRELKNAIDRLALLGFDSRIDVTDLHFIGEAEARPFAACHSSPVLGRDDFDLPHDGLDLEWLNCDVVERALVKNRGNKTRTARYLGISRRVLDGLLKKQRSADD
jgi:DNA-binding NtrC family response regulator